MRLWEARCIMSFEKILKISLVWNYINLYDALSDLFISMYGKGYFVLFKTKICFKSLFFKRVLVLTIFIWHFRVHSRHQSVYSQKLRVYSQMVHVFWQKVCVYSRMVRECSAFILLKLIEIVKRHLHNICAQLNMFSCGWIKIVFYWLFNTYREIIFLFWSVFNIINKQISTGVEGNMHWFY